MILNMLINQTNNLRYIIDYMSTLHKTTPPVKIVNQNVLQIVLPKTQHKKMFLYQRDKILYHQTHQQRNKLIWRILLRCVLHEKLRLNRIRLHFLGPQVLLLLCLLNKLGGAQFVHLSSSSFTSDITLLFRYFLLVCHSHIFLMIVYVRRKVRTVV